MLLRATTVTLLFLVGFQKSATIHAQGVSVKRSFEVASVKPSSSCTDRSPTITPSSLRLRCVTLRGLLRGAYNLVDGRLAPTRIEVLGGPAWIDSEHFDIVAKTEAPASRVEMLGPMMRALVEERFKVKVHRESRETPVYSLAVPKGELTLRPSKPGTCTPVSLENGPPARSRLPRCGQGDYRGDGAQVIVDWYGVTMGEFSRELSTHLDRAVVDRTGLVGEFDINLEFARDIKSGPITLNGQMSSEPPQSDDPSSPTIFTAVRRQTGLILARDKLPIDVIVVDSAERPSGN